MENIIFNNIEFYKIKDFDDYYISKCGKVLSIKKYHSTNIRILKPQTNTWGYNHVHLNNKFKTVHRLVLSTFIPNINNLREVNHINGIKSDNRLDNLEWISSSENSLHALKNGLQKPTKPWLGKFGKLHHNHKKVGQYDLNGNLINIFYGCHEAGRMLNLDYRFISDICLNKKKYTKGYIFKYINY